MTIIPHKLGTTYDPIPVIWHTPLLDLSPAILVWCAAVEAIDGARFSRHLSAITKNCELYEKDISRSAFPRTIRPNADTQLQILFTLEKSARENAQVKSKITRWCDLPPELYPHELQRTKYGIEWRKSGTVALRAVANRWVVEIHGFHKARQSAAVKALKEMEALKIGGPIVKPVNVAMWPTDNGWRWQQLDAHLDHAIGGSNHPSRDNALQAARYYLGQANDYSMLRFDASQIAGSNLVGIDVNGCGCGLAIARTRTHETVYRSFLELCERHDLDIDLVTSLPMTYVEPY